MTAGVKDRLVPGGDGFAAAHRGCAPKDSYLIDVDAVADGLGQYHRTEDRAFFSYACGPWAERDNPAREFGIAAIFDRTESLATAFSPRKMHGTQVLRGIARWVGRGQGVMPKFFLVAGPESGPWDIVELDVMTGERSGEPLRVSRPGSWAATWQAMGLTEIQDQLRERLKNAA